VSLLDQGPHTLLVQLVRSVTDAYGGSRKVDDGPPLTVTGAMVQPLTAAEATGLGVRPDTSYRVICRSWPGGIHSKVRWVDQSRDLFQRGETTLHTVGRRTQHHSAVLVANNAEVK
jgi:hypothetical protein